MRSNVRRNTKKAKELREGIAFVVMTVFLICLLSFFITGTVISQAKDDTSVEESYYNALEKEYRKEIRSYLAENGFENCGVTVTKVLHEEGTREYTVLLHHSKLEKITIAERTELFQNIKQMAFEGTECSFTIGLYQ